MDTGRDPTNLFEMLDKKSRAGDADAGSLICNNYFSGELITHVALSHSNLDCLASFMERYKAGLAIEKSAVEVLKG